MSLDRIKLTHQLAIAFVLVALIGACVSIVGTVMTSQLASQIKAMAEGPMTNVESLTALSDRLHSIDRNSQNYVITWDSATRSRAAEEIDKAKADIEYILKELEKNLSESRSKDLLKAIDSAKDPYFQSITKIIKMANDGAIQGAGQLLVGEVSEQQKKLADALNKSRDFEKLAVRSVSEEAQSDSKRTSQLLLSLAALVVAFCAATGIVTARNLTKVIAVLINQTQKISAGDLTDTFDVPNGKTEAALMLGALKEMQSSLIDVVAGVRSASNGVALASSEIAQGNTNLSDRTEQQASALEETAASMEELNSKVAQNAESSQRAHELAIAASQTAKSGGEVVGTVIHTMKEISDSSRRIAEIIGVINGIAFQTNILALNAAVEAARAGDQGRGFAVVASEVRTLAGRSAEAAKQINELVSTNVQRVERGTALADSAGKTMDGVVDSIQRVTELMVEISAASKEQSLGVQQVSEAVSQMDMVTQQNAALVEQMAAAAIGLKSLSDEQVRVVSVFLLPETGNKSEQKDTKETYLLANGLHV
jgi:methyl-accepting chemotaxis protein